MSESHENAQCTANTKVSSRHSIRCVRELGHGGLHRYYHKGYVVEFADTKAWFPHYQEFELEENPSDGGW